MTDVFIAYAHDDQAFAHLLARGLEAEGLSVWWDHTIPPGKTWDTHIAAAIDAAKACIVVWSARSVGSDWVKEEATLARDADKFLPVALDTSLPPVGFRRIQAALLAGWTGDRSHPQFQLLVREVRALAGGARPAPLAPLAPSEMAPVAPAPVQPPPQPVHATAAAPTAATPYPTPYAPVPPAAGAPQRSNPLAVMAGIGVGALLGLVAVFAFIRQDAPSPPAAPVTAPATAPAAPAPVEGVDEAQRLIDERDAALQRAEEARALTEQQEIAAALAEEERQAQQRASSQQPSGFQAAGSGQPVQAFLGEWRLIRTDSGDGCPQSTRLRLQGPTLYWDYAPDGSWQENLSSSEYAVTPSGRLEFQPPGGVYWGEMRNGQLTLNQMYSRCTFARAR